MENTLRDPFVPGTCYTRNAKGMYWQYVIILTPMVSLWHHNDGSLQVGELEDTVAGAQLRDDFVWRLVE